MNNRDKFLSEMMNLVYHEPYFDSDENTWVGECEQKWNVNFSTWVGFGKLFEFCQTQKWWDEFVYDTLPVDHSYINPDKFADTVYEFIKGDRK